MQGGKYNPVLIIIAAIALGGAYALSSQRAAEPEVIRITAKRFEYNPPRIELRQGVPVILELTALDRLHGFSIPDLDLRADVLPGQTVQVELLPKKAGAYPFLCDIFCGEGHDEMSGIIVVRD